MSTAIMYDQLTTGSCATLACLLEAIAPKPGNVHRGADFENLTFTDFAVSAAAIGPIMEHAALQGVGATAALAVQATHRLVGTNTNLGTILLLAPLAAAQGDRDRLRTVLRTLSPADADGVYLAIRRANAGGLGQVDDCDVHGPAPDDLLAAMRLAADRDRVAFQFANDFVDVFESVTPWLVEGRAQGWPLTTSIVQTQLRLLSQFGDSLIARKCGPRLSEQVAARATAVLAAGGPGDDDYEQALGDLDFWMRSDGHRRNPGTTADLIAAGLFVGLRTGLLQPPFA